jgi:hypothetical protein
VPRGISELVAADSANDTSNVPLTTPANTPTTPQSLGLDIEAHDAGYIATIQMGTPPRDFKLLMDSGSADLWVGAEGCKSVTGGDCVSFTSKLFSPLINLLIHTVL